MVKNRRPIAMSEQKEEEEEEELRTFMLVGGWDYVGGGRLLGTVLEFDAERGGWLERRDLRLTGLRYGHSAMVSKIQCAAAEDPS